MNLKKIHKLRHFLYAKINEKSTLKSLKDETFGNEIINAFTESKTQLFAKDISVLFKDLEGFRMSLLESDAKIDFSVFEPNLILTVKEICSKAASPKIWCEFFFLVSYYIEAKKILEIGTNLGISGQYYLNSISINSNSKNDIEFTTLEGVKDLCEIAEKRFNEIAQGTTNFNVICGLYDNSLPDVIKTNSKFNIIFIDGNHHYEPTLRYYKQLLSNTSEKCIIIFDDINWSQGMMDAWKAVKESNYSYSIDLFKLGLIVIDKSSKDKPKRDYQLFLSR